VFDLDHPPPKPYGATPDDCLAGRIDRTPARNFMWVFHATDRQRAAAFLRQGVRIADKPANLARHRYEQGEYAEFAPGRGLSSGLYVGWWPCEVEGYGRQVLALGVRKEDLGVPPEARVRGTTTVGWALLENDAVVERDVPPECIVPICSPGRVCEPPHKEFVRYALRAGYRVSARVLAEYPDLARVEKISGEVRANPSRRHAVPRTATLPAGTLVYHGTSQTVAFTEPRTRTWFSTSLALARRFSHGWLGLFTRQAVAQRVLVYRTKVPFELLVLRGEPGTLTFAASVTEALDLEEWSDARDAQGCAELVCSAGYAGWRSEEAYGRAEDDVLLCDARGKLTLVGIETLDPDTREWTRRPVARGQRGTAARRNPRRRDPGDRSAAGRRAP